MLKEFREFVARGSLVDLAVAFIIGVAFAGVVSAFTDVVLGAVSYAVGGDVTFDRLGVHRGSEIVIPYGAFLSALLDFVLVAFVLFLIVRTYNRFRRRIDAPPSGPTEVELLTEIRDELRRG
jgi:large conductance mechanosensitive channel